MPRASRSRRSRPCWPSSAAPPSTWAVPRPDADAAAEGHAAERAFTSVAALGDILIQAIRTPLSRVGSGALGAADRRRLAEDLPHPDDVDPLISLAERAGLLAADARSFMPTAAADDWLAASTPDRWTSAARAWWIAVPAPLTASARLTDPAGWPAAFPADPAWPDRGAAFRREAEAWGIVTPTGAAPSWTRLIGADPAAAARELATLMPREVDRIYLQNDLTAISPGPLAPGLDVRLRRIAVRESHAQASSYRFTAETVAGALTEGENAESILAFLAELSLTGVPQPLDYLVRTTAERHGTVRVGDDPDAPADATRTRVWSSSPEALEPIAVDQSLRPLGLVRTADGSALTSRVARDTVLWALIDARYPAIAVDADGTTLRLRRHRVAVSAPRDRRRRDVRPYHPPAARGRRGRRRCRVARPRARGRRARAQPRRDRRRAAGRHRAHVRARGVRHGRRPDARPRARHRRGAHPPGLEHPQHPSPVSRRARRGIPPVD